MAAVELADEYQVLSSSEACDEAFETIRVVCPTFDKNALHDILANIKSAGDLLLDETLRISYIERYNKIVLETETDPSLRIEFEAR